MNEECNGTGRASSLVQITVTRSECDKMPAGDTLVLDGPSLDYARSGPVCLTAINAIYPWIMLARFNVKSPALDYDEADDCYRPSCPCGIVSYEIRRLEQAQS